MVMQGAGIALARKKQTVGFIITKKEAQATGNGSFEWAYTEVSN